jgi:DNA polymerase alpha-associated DNA helicase A
MNEYICAFPSSTLYSSKLLSDPSVASRLLSDNHPNKDTVQDTLGHPVVFFDTSGCEFYERVDSTAGGSESKISNDEGSKCNANEVEVVRAWVTELVTSGVAPSEIAIITPSVPTRVLWVYADGVRLSGTKHS